MNRDDSLARVLATVLIFTLPLAFVPPTAGAENASLAGTVHSPSGEQPLDGAVLHAGDIRSGLIYSSARTEDDGSFVLTGLPPAAYQLAVETDDGLFLVGSSVQLEAGQQRNVQLELKKKKTTTADDPETAQAKQTGGKMGFMNNPLFASLTVIGASVVLGALISEIDDSDEGLASPFAP